MHYLTDIGVDIKMNHQEIKYEDVLLINVGLW
jgi:hypothetical protein